MRKNTGTSLRQYFSRIKSPQKKEALFNFEFFFHIQLFALCIIEFILQKRETLVGDNFHSKSVFHLPLSLQRHQSLIDVCSYIRMNVQGKFLNLHLIDKIVNLTL